MEEGRQAPLHSLGAWWALVFWQAERLDTVLVLCPENFAGSQGLDKGVEASKLMICIGYNEAPISVAMCRTLGPSYALPVATEVGVSAFNYQEAGDALCNKGVSTMERRRLRGRGGGTPCV